MEVIFHIGMGKTGTSSIQQVLGANQEELAKIGVQYLGLWFNLLDPEFAGYAGQDRFFASSPEQMKTHAENYHLALKALSEKTGNDRFIISNESMYGYVTQFSPFLQELKKKCTVKLVIYARDPYSWLPSAYNQWALYHKTMPGPVPSYQKATPAMLATYSGLRLWAKDHLDIIELRHLKRGMDVVSDFSDLLSLFLPPPEKNTLERKDPAENAIRAVFNETVGGPVLPTEFDRITGNVELSASPDLEKLVSDMFDYGATSDMVAGQSALFDEISSIYGVDIRQDKQKEHAAPDVEAFRNRVLEHLMTLTLQQARRVTELETTVRQLRRQVAKLNQTTAKSA
ncbi:polysaccharide biosynthesis protein [Mangrovicoccus algicola]|uniref:Polysaccharide biosynthesis protein n=1 Tax=Mangrovicoccus algicola TaxID=2771008 RepID=A0A8J7CKN3_9RHOB|nr:polysaccharide biosynthesis protein [Mangrovicoccus algicola]MBE3639046.1 polysaccharide biosynthesis protein [Mangrovicoccus algicola]